MRALPTASTATGDSFPMKSATPMQLAQHPQRDLVSVLAGHEGSELSVKNQQHVFGCFALADQQLAVEAGPDCSGLQDGVKQAVRQSFERARLAHRRPGL